MEEAIKLKVHKVHKVFKVLYELYNFTNFINLTNVVSLKFIISLLVLILSLHILQWIIGIGLILGFIYRCIFWAAFGGDALFWFYQKRGTADYTQTNADNMQMDTNKFSA